VQRFKYRVETVSLDPNCFDEQLASVLNQWGRQGWRACHLAIMPSEEQPSKARIVLERRLASWLLSDEDD
jgi:hypothetical protein